MIYWIGKHSKIFRFLYWKLTGTWYWGITSFLNAGKMQKRYWDKQWQEAADKTFIEWFLN